MSGNAGFVCGSVSGTDIGTGTGLSDSCVSGSWNVLGTESFIGYSESSIGYSESSIGGTESIVDGMGPGVVGEIPQFPVKQFVGQTVIGTR